MLCRLLQGAVELSHYWNLSVTKLMQCFPEDLRLVEKLKDKVTSDDFNATQDASNITLLDSSVP